MPLSGVRSSWTCSRGIALQARRLLELAVGLLEPAIADLEPLRERLDLPLGLDAPGDVAGDQRVEASASCSEQASEYSTGTPAPVDRIASVRDICPARRCSARGSAADDAPRSRCSSGSPRSDSSARSNRRAAARLAVRRGLAHRG
jgi:hypothetical protein